MKEIKNNEKEIINEILNTITKYYPKMDREKVIFGNKNTQMDIIIQFMNIEEKDYTSIYFCNGDINARTSLNVPERFLVNDLISSNTINELIFTILEDYDYFRCASLEHDNIEIELGLDMLYGQRPGISCERICLNLEFYKHPRKEYLMEEYIDEIIKVYKYEIDHALGISDRLKYKLTKMH